jgi:ATP sulfurylase
VSLKIIRLDDGTVWPLPICLDVKEEVAASLQPGQKLALNDHEGFLLAVMTVRDIWQPDKQKEARLVYGTDNAVAHPGVQQLMTQVHDWYVSGPVEGISLPIHHDFRDLRITPSETHRRFTQYGWRRVLGFHTEEYLHCAHREMVMAAAREIGASIFLHPVVGLESPGSLDHYTHVRCYQAFVNKFPKNMIMLGLTPWLNAGLGRVKHSGTRLSARISVAATSWLPMIMAILLPVRPRTFFTRVMPPRKWSRNTAGMRASRWFRRNGWGISKTRQVMFFLRTSADRP